MDMNNNFGGFGFEGLNTGMSGGDFESPLMKTIVYCIIAVIIISNGFGKNVTIKLPLLIINEAIDNVNNMAIILLNQFVIMIV